MSIPFIPTNSNEAVQKIEVNGTGIPLIQGSDINNIGINGNRIANIRNSNIEGVRGWVSQPSQAIPPTVPVTVQAGTPIVNMPGCVKVHKENAKRDPSSNKNLVNDDPKGQTTLCDAGAPYFTAPNYDARSLMWETIYQEQPEQEGGVDTGDTGDLTPPETPEPPPQESEEGDPDCPGPLDPRIGSVGPSEKEKVVGHELQPDPNNLNKKICVTLYEDIGIVEQYLPSAQVATTTAVIASVAASSALLAKPLADLLLKVVKPVIKKVVTKVKKIMGKTEPVLSVRERLLAQRDRNRAVMELRKALKK